MSENDPEFIEAIDRLYDSLSFKMGHQKYVIFRDSIIKGLSSFKEIPSPLEFYNMADKVITELVNKRLFSIGDADKYYEWSQQTLMALEHEIKGLDSPHERKEALRMLLNFGKDLTKSEWDKIKQHEASKEVNDTGLTKLSQNLYKVGYTTEPLSFEKAIQNTGKCDWQKDIRLLDFLLYHMTKNETERNKGFAVIIANRFLKKGKPLTVEKVKNNLSHKSDKDYHSRTQSSGQQVILDLLSESKIN